MATTESIVTQSEENTTPELVKENRTMEVLTDEDLEKTAQDFAEYLVVNNQQEVLYYIHIYIYIYMNEGLYEPLYVLVMSLFTLSYICMNVTTQYCTFE